tara:strand:+ start:12406 stop:12909 length:504 start_codon:yes stop_codon:yes gene_type:complete
LVVKVHSKYKIFILVLSLLITIALACGSDGSVDKSVSTKNGGEDTAPVLRVDETFSIDNFQAAGFKLNKEFDTETVPLATNVYYGFAERRDIEIRKYSSHADAMSAGVESALAAIGRSPNSNSGGGIITSTGNRTSYHAYLVAGNVVMLCQTDISACQNLAQTVQSD